MQVPFFRPDVGEPEIEEVVRCLRSGWLTTGPMTRRFEQDFCAATGAKYAVALNSCTAALHLAVEALGLRAGQAVLIPTMTFAATAEVIRYLGALPILVDCDSLTGNIDLRDAEQKIAALRSGRFEPHLPRDAELVGIIPVHVAGLMMDTDAVAQFASAHGLWVVEDAAHSLPAAWRPDESSPWRRCGDGTAAVTCFSFYANKTITTGEGGMAVTNREDLALQMRSMSLHGLSHDAWKRYSGGSWDYRILAPGYKYNLTDIASAIGVHQLARAEEMRLARAAIAAHYRSALESSDVLELPVEFPNRIHSHHLFAIRLHLDRLTVARDEFKQALQEAGVGSSVHWRPLHLHPYYEEQFGWSAADFPVASADWKRRISLPLFPGMRPDEVEYVVDSVAKLGRKFSR